jgi:hypothetical protein
VQVLSGTLTNVLKPPAIRLNEWLRAWFTSLSSWVNITAAFFIPMLFDQKYPEKTTVSFSEYQFSEKKPCFISKSS